MAALASRDGVDNVTAWTTPMPSAQRGPSERVGKVERMKALVLTAPGQLELFDQPRTELRDDEVRLRVEAAGICGSDVHGFAGINDRRPAGVIMGHETVGRVMEFGACAPEALQVGTLVAVNPVIACGECQYCLVEQENLCGHRRLYGCSLDLRGGLASEMVVVAKNCVPLEERDDLLSLVWIEPMAVGTHAVRVAEAPQGADVLVVGGGPIGVAVALACLERGLHPMISEPVDTRRVLAESLGIPTCKPADLAGMAQHFDMALECVGSSATIGSALMSVRAGGTVVCLGLAEEKVAILAVPLVVGERRLLGSSAYTKRDFELTARWVSGRTGQLAALCNPISLAQMPQAFAEYQSGQLQAMKTLYLASG